MFGDAAESQHCLVDFGIRDRQRRQQSEYVVACWNTQEFVVVQHRENFPDGREALQANQKASATYFAEDRGVFRYKFVYLQHEP